MPRKNIPAVKDGVLSGYAVRRPKTASGQTYGHLLTVIIIIGILSVVACERNILWLDEVNLWGDVTVKSPDKARGYNNRGVAYADKGLHDRAIGDFDKAIALDPDSAKAYSNRGLAYNNKGLHDRAIGDLDKAIALEPDYAFAYYNRGIVYNNKGLHDRAIVDFDNAIALNPDYAKAYNNRGLAYAMKDIVDRAVSDFQTACSLGIEDGCKNLQKVLDGQGRMGSGLHS